MKEKKDNKLILISMDCVRADHLGCYGYKKITTPNIDSIAREGLLFENVITASCLTPVSMSSILTGNFPNRHGLRDPFGLIQSETIAEIFKKSGCKTAGFVGIDFLSRRCGFDKGFDIFKEPTAERGWHTKKYESKEGKTIDTIWGYWWVNELLDFIDKNYDQDFFVWGHYFETHVAAERWLLKEGLIQENINSDWDYYDAKIKCLDEHFFAPLINLLKKRGIWEKTTLAIVSDHGETFDEHTHKQDYAQHQSMYNTDLRVPLIIKDAALRPSRVKEKVRTIDLAPTLLKLALGEEGQSMDGKDLLQDGKSGDLLVYSEDIYELRGYGSMQAVQDEQYKLIRNNTRKEEEFYDLRQDHFEKNNLISQDRYKKTIDYFRATLDRFLSSNAATKAGITREEEEEVKIRLKSLGYID